MTETMYVRASEVAEMTGVSKAKAYKLIAQMNEELKSRNFIVISGRVPRKYLMERLYKWKGPLTTAIVKRPGSNLLNYATS